MSSPSLLALTMQEAAEEKLWSAIRALQLPNLTFDIQFRVEPGVGSAYWTQSDPTQRATIVVDQALILRLPQRCAQALLLHEIMHHIGYNRSLLNPDGKNRFLVNLALDICLERALSECDPQLKQDLRLLNDLLLGTTSVSRTSRLHETLVFFVHSAPPFKRLPRGFRVRWRQIWAAKRLRITAEDVYSLLAGIPGAQRSESAADTVFEQRYRHRPRIDWSPDSGSAGDATSNGSPQAAGTPADGAGSGTGAGRLARDAPQIDSTGSTEVKAERAAGTKSAATHSTEVAAQLCTGEPGDCANPAQPTQPMSLGQLVQFVQETLQNNRRAIKVNPAKESPLGLPARAQLIRDIRTFDAFAAVRELTDVGDELTIANSPFLSNPTSKGVADYLSGQPQLYFENWVRHTPTLSCLYFDVSGSMSEHLPQMVAFAATLQTLRPAKVFVFDSEVTQVTLDDVATGRVFTGGGTNIDAVLEHVLQHKPRQFFIVTDNMDHIRPGLLIKLKEARIQSLALVFGSQRQPWDRAYYVPSKLPELDLDDL